MGLGDLRAPPSARSLARSLGVTRVARLTGLDRSGIEVACAVRPVGHVLQVANGKGRSFAEARAGALSEAAELFGAERLDPAELLYGTLEGLRDRHGEAAVWDASDLGSAVAPALWSARIFCAFRPAVDLMSGEAVLIPAQAVHCPPEGSVPLGPIAVAWTSNGMGAHPSPARALRHALLEAIERDQLARALPRGWTEREIALRRLRLDSLARIAPGAAALARRFDRTGFQLELFDLVPRGGLGLPVAGALLFDPGGAVPLTAGYACHLRRDRALQGALLEAAQSRLTDIHGAREDLGLPDPRLARRLARACAAAPSRSAATLPDVPVTTATAALAAILDRLRRRGHERAATVELAPSGFPLSIQKVIVPGLRLSELL